MLAPDLSLRPGAAAFGQARHDGYRGPIAVIEVLIGTEPEPERHGLVEVMVRTVRRVAGARRRSRPVIAFSALCETVLASVPVASEAGARPCTIFAALLARGVEVRRRRFLRAMQKLAQDRRVRRAGSRGGAVTYRRVAP